ncbi:hypothetical protein BJF83_14570 [Nocardiopsis sp. CNR-923]|uniref:DUF6507 family protein n=1 Tax=Nocardiopsis sp. CNR-923 TaxID=1904965 RepID=UPI00095E660B|nr:DUF6507 family protein [Nocardiopsis sp. CNR-923]OLT28713.1 hypothetical protein BJF83_14570 [Nocardiopsis sp. CNR-923]
MTSWDIQPGEVLSVLESVMGHVGGEGSGEGLVGCIDRMETSLINASSHAKSVAVSMALAEFAEHYFAFSGDMVALTGSAIEGAGEATVHYNNGNLEMAAESQANAGEIPPRPWTPATRRSPVATSPSSHPHPAPVTETGQ